MSRQVEIHGADGTIRKVRESEFPLSVGGVGSDVEVAGVSGAEPVAWLGIADARVFLQRVEGRPGVQCNGATVDSSQWIHSGDELRIGATRIDVEAAPQGLRLRIASAVREFVTEPPTLAPGETDEATVSRLGSGESLTPADYRPRTVSVERGPRRGVRPLAAFSWVALLLLAGAAWILFTVRAVELRVEPEPDRMEVSGDWPTFELGGRTLLYPGHYTIAAERSGYRPLDAPIEIDSEAPRRLEFAMDKLPGLLAIDVGKIVGAEVLIDGVSHGVTPIEPIELPEGEYDVRVRAERFTDFRATVAIEGAGHLQTVVAEMPGRWSAIAFRSEPSGASLLIDGKRVGTTPFTGDLLAGRHGYEISLPGYRSHRGEIDVEANRPRDLPLVELRLADARLSLSSEPDGASITIDGKFRGRTPADLDLPPRRSVRVELSLMGYDDQFREVELEPGEQAEIAVSLIARLGEISITVEPPDAEIAVSLVAQLGEISITVEPPDAELLVDGRSMGAASRILQLPAAPHELEIARDGYETFRTSVTPRPGFPQRLDVTLVTPEQRERASIPDAILAPQGQPMVLVEGGSFRMGASRREPGRRANEAFRDVDLTRAFYISKHEISNEEFREFDPNHLSGRVASVNLENDTHPVVRVTWEDAARYCNWLSATESLTPVYRREGDTMVAARPPGNGYRLPTEAEWARVARFSGGGSSNKYAWGSELPVAPASGNYADLTAAQLLSNTVREYDDGFPATAPVDHFDPNALGLHNLGGNVAEWIHDIYTIYPSATTIAEIDPVGPADGELHVIRGSSWMDFSVSELRLTYRDYGAEPRPDLGFRIARYAK